MKERKTERMKERKKETVIATRICLLELKYYVAVTFINTYINIAIVSLLTTTTGIEMASET